MAHPMQHHGQREKKPTTSVLYRKVDPGQPTPWWMVEVDGPVYRKHMTDHACDVCRDESESVYHAGDCWWLVEVGEETE